jgi:hypothetical protein
VHKLILHQCVRIVRKLNINGIQLIIHHLQSVEHDAMNVVLANNTSINVKHSSLQNVKLAFANQSTNA